MATAGRLHRLLFFPLLGSLLQNRREALALTLAAALQLGLSFFEISVWECPFLAVLGIPCPGCGLSTACILLLQGRWQEALAAHAFAPLLLGLLGLAAVVSLLPGPAHSRAALAISKIESRTAVSAAGLFGLFLYWGLRLSHII